MNMVSVMKGLDVRKSRFAALSLDQDSSDEDGEKQWQQVLPTKSKPPPKKGPPTQSGQTQGEEAKGLSKNAKKRARKRRNKSTSSDHDGEVVAAAEKKTEDKVDEKDVWKKKNEEAVEEEYQKELREALVQSTIEAKNYEKLMREMKEAEERAMAATSKTTKKATKLSLQELHRLPSAGVASPPPPEQSPKVVKNQPSLDGAYPLSPEDVTEDGPFSPLLEDVEAEVKKVMTREKKPSKDWDSEMMGPRIAQLENELEKKDKIIAKLKKDNTALKKSLTEAKERNQSLCAIMNQGEFSKKVELLKQVNELSAIKNDLALEVETLSSSLEQERSRSKALKAQVHQITNSHTKSKN